MPTSASASDSSVAVSATRRHSDLLPRLASSDGLVQVKALRELKNRIIGNRTKKLSFIKLGLVPAVADILASKADAGDGRHSDLLIQSAAVVGSFACGFDAGVHAVLDAGVFPSLVRLLSHLDEKVVDAGARSLRMIYQSKLAPKYDFLQQKNMEFLLSLLNSENENVTGLGASIIMHSCETVAEQKALCQAGVLKKLISLLKGSLSQRDASLESLATIIKNNVEAVSEFVGSDSGRALSSVIELTKDRYPRTRLLASVCLIVIRNTCPCYLQDIGIKTKLVYLLLELHDDPGQVGDEASFAFCTLIAGREDLQKLAFEANAIDKLYNHLQKGALHPKRVEGILLAMAELCSKLDSCRFKFISLKALDLVINGLTQDSAGVRAAACICLKSVSRSIKSLCAGDFMNEMIVIPLVQLLDDSCTSVQESIFGELEASSLASLVSDSEPLVQEQALALVRNLVDGCVNCIEFVFAENGIILDAVGRQLQSIPKVEIGIQGMYLLCNVASGNEFHKEAVMHQLVPQAENGTQSFMIKFLQSSDSQLRTAAVWTIINLTFPSVPGAFGRLVKLRNAGIISQVKTMVNDPCLEVKLRIRTALAQFMTSDDGSI
ncbi:Coatomer beta subunit [Trema orientale]|uniref:Coatomer beta subunit n=1 Tax=Trema orientale TaxID=63057 RepID=A0A2P5EUF4_TREOI|nr:Coatomer beta subunit [Trema orientale]